MILRTILPLVTVVRECSRTKSLTGAAVALGTTAAHHPALHRNYLRCCEPAPANQQEEMPDLLRIPKTLIEQHPFYVNVWVRYVSPGPTTENRAAASDMIM